MDLPADSVNEDSSESTAGGAAITPMPAPPNAETPRPAVGRCVCPFCANIHSRAETICPKCKTENNAANRAAARSKVGPWHVINAANSNATGIKWQALLDLIVRGQINVRTVVRGPSTNQLWRFAGRTRGLGREFGICYGCGQVISRTTEVCPECQRWQLPPANPDALLETIDEPVVKPVYRQVTEPTAPTPVQTPVAPQQPAAETVAEPVTVPVPLPAPVTEINEPAPEPPERNAATTPARQQHLPRAILTPRELAAAFSLEYPSARGSRRTRSGLGPRRIITAVLALATIFFIGILCWDSPLRDSLSDWAENVLGMTQHRHTATGPGPSNPVPRVADPSPPTSPPPFELPPSVAVTQASAAPQPNPVVVIPPAATPLVATPPPAPPAAPPAVTPIVHATDAQSVDTSADAEQQIDLAMALFADAIDAESRNDYSSAVWYYEKIKQKVPKEDWPLGLDIRLEAAKRKALQQSLKPQ